MFAFEHLINQFSGTSESKKLNDVEFVDFSRQKSCIKQKLFPASSLPVTLKNVLQKHKNKHIFIFISEIYSHVNRKFFFGL